MLSTHAIDLRLPQLFFLAKSFILLGLCFLMLCVPILNKCFWAAIILILCEGSWKQSWRIIAKDPVIIAGLLLALCFTIGITYSQASWHYNLRIWDKYLKIVYLLIFLPIFFHPKMRRMAIFCFFVSVMLSEVFAYLHYFNVLDLGFPPSKHWLFVQDIDSGFVVSFAAYMLANFALDNKKYRGLVIGCFLICAFDVMVLNQERTGYLIFLALMALFLLQRFHWRGVVSALIAVPLLFGSLYVLSPKFKDRSNQVVSDIVGYREGIESTSIGLRLAFAKYSFKVIRHNLFFGTGTGSFEEIYRKLNGPKINDLTWPAHPHNEYIAILFQLGITGLLVFAYWICTQIYASFQLPKQERILLQGLILSFLLLGFCNASLLVNPAGACYIVFLSIFLASKYDGRKC
jgi:O-antigen ligase